MSKQTIRLAVLVTLLALALTAGMALAMSSTNYALNWATYAGNGGGNLASTNYDVGFTIGQTVIGASSSTNYSIGWGYWYGAVAKYKVYLPLLLKNP